MDLQSIVTSTNVEWDALDRESYARALGLEIGRVLAEYAQVNNEAWRGILAEKLQPLYVALQHSIQFETLVIDDLDAFYQNRADFEQTVFWQFDGANFLCFLLDKKGHPVTLLLNSPFGRLVHRIDESGWQPTKGR